MSRDPIAEFNDAVRALRELYPEPVPRVLTVPRNVMAEILRGSTPSPADAITLHGVELRVNPYLPPHLMVLENSDGSTSIIDLSPAALAESERVALDTFEPEGMTRHEYREMSRDVEREYRRFRGPRHRETWLRRWRGKQRRRPGRGIRRPRP